MATEIKRMRYFDGLFLKEQEFQLDQEYNLRMRRLHNRHLHGYGIAWGLDVTSGPGTQQVTIQPGMAIDRFSDPVNSEEIGREIVVVNDLVVDLSGFNPGDGVYVYVSYNELEIDVVPDRGGSEEIHWLENAQVGTGTSQPGDLTQFILLAKVILDAVDGTVENILEEENNVPLRTLIGTTGGGTIVSGGGTGKNYIRNPNGETSSSNWTNAPSLNLSVVRTAITGEVLSGTFSFQLTGTAGMTPDTDYITVAMNAIDEEDKNQLMAVELSFKGLEAWEAGLLKVVIHDIANDVDIYPNPHLIPGGQGKFRGTFSTTDSSNYELRLVAAQTPSALFRLAVDSVSVGPNNTVVGPAIGDWEPTTMTVDAEITAPTFGVLSINKAFRKRVGDSYAYKFDLEQTDNTGAAAGNGAYIFTPPDTIDMTKIHGDGALGLATVGSASFEDTGAFAQAGYAKLYSLNGKTGFTLFVGADGVGFNFISHVKGAPSNPGTLRWSFETMPIPIVGLSSNIILSDSRTEYVYNSDTSENADTASFATGEAGGLVPNMSNSGGVPDQTKFVRKRCQVSRPYKHFRLEFNTNGDTFWSLGQYVAQSISIHSLNTASFYGAYIEPISSTEFDVVFNARAYESASLLGGGYGSRNWDAEHAAGTRWRVVASDNPQFVETAPREILSAESAELTVPSNGVWHQFVGNSFDLTPGEWMLTGAFAMKSNGSNPNYQLVNMKWSGEPGANGAEPADLVELSSGRNRLRLVLPANEAVSSSDYDVPAPTVYLKTTALLTVYLNARLDLSTPSNARVTAYLSAVRLS